MLTKCNRLRKNREYQYTFKRGKSVRTPLFYMYWVDTKLGVAKAGFSINKKVGNSVIRSRTKRLLSEAVRLRLNQCKIKNLVFVALPTMARARYSEVEACVIDALQKADILC